VKIVRGQPGKADESIRAKFRECGGALPLRLFVMQRRRVGGALVAEAKFSRLLPRARPIPSPGGVTCRDYTVTWRLTPAFFGAGWLHITLRLVDARGEASGAPSYALRAPQP
jgi:hypothetical protein